MTKLRLPTWKDPRFYMVCTLVLFVLLAQYYLGFSQTRAQIWAGLLTCVLLDFTFTYATSRKIIAPLSGLISGLSLALLLDSGPRVLPFVLVGALSISSKYVVKYRGKHFFNPTNFGLAIVLLLGMASITPGYQWGGGTTALWIALSMGGMILFRVRRLALIFSFIGFFMLSALLRYLLFHESFILAFGLMTGAPFQLFTFFMLPDPRTTPAQTGSQIGFALAVVATDLILRLIRVPNTLFLSLFYVDLIVMAAALFGISFSVSKWPATRPVSIIGAGGNPSDQPVIQLPTNIHQDV